MRRVIPVIAAGLWATFPGVGPLWSAEDPHVGLALKGDGIEVKIDGKLFTAYRFDELGTPIFYPVIGPFGRSMTRHYPMKKGVPGELTDHEHHRSIWFGHRDVNGHSFWSVARDPGVTVHRAVRKMVSGGGGRAALIAVENDLVSAAGAAVCSEAREYRIRGLGRGEVLLDYIVTIKADKGTEVRFGNQKDGIMAIRVAPWLRFEDRKGVRGTGEILNSEGLEGKEAWGQRADWVDYYGTDPDGNVCGVALFDHPENLRHPTWWHARSYGLLTANPFGQGDFEKGKAPEEAGNYTVKEGDELRLWYRFYFHRGDAKEAQVVARYREFAGE